jgi:hypothetical protein
MRLGNSDVLDLWSKQEEWNMISEMERLRRVSDSVFHEAEQPESSSSRPLEWRRTFKRIDLPLSNVKIVDSYNVHFTDFPVGGGVVVNPLSMVSQQISNDIVIEGVVDESKTSDFIYFAAQDSEEKPIYSTTKARGDWIVFLRNGQPTEAEEETHLWGTYPAGQ